ncbi:MAG: adenylyl-sulfate kinase [Deltaproteobacteria bacterium]|nr:adenylyl-sulfate kinase [Deltaproteobacteria bacterium]MDA8306263.1 adenylyl-sulfate kinase [Deltaproteobacteria bacterium]
MIDAKVKATNIVWHNPQATKAQREALLNQRGATIWLTGLPSSGKSTTAYGLEFELIEKGFLAYVLDGDNVRHGLNKDLGFSAEDRAENIRRVAETAKLFADAGLIVITSFISPYRVERDFARRIHLAAGLNFAEIYIDTPVEVCEGRDPKGLYAKARRGELKGFTGIDDPYEPPLSPELVCRTEEFSPREVVFRIIEFMVEEGFLEGRAHLWPYGRSCAGK